jgi:hypothetical protein
LPDEARIRQLSYLWRHSLRTLSFLEVIRLLGFAHTLKQSINFVGWPPKYLQPHGISVRQQMPVVRLLQFNERPHQSCVSRFRFSLHIYQLPVAPQELRGNPNSDYTDHPSVHQSVLISFTNTSPPNSASRSVRHAPRHRGQPESLFFA